jgi:phosphatidylserine decarboxylase
LRISGAGLPPAAALVFMAAGGYAVSPFITAALIFPLALTVWFYRDPDRTPPDDPDIWVSPADGRVVEIEETTDSYAGRTTKIGIFMNGFDVHVNRFPAPGEIEKIVHVPGKKWFAFAPKASELNERLYVHAATPHGKTTLVQIAGIVARRIVCYKKEGDTLARGERYGMIQLGSKVDLYLPEGVAPSVRLGDKLKAGKSAIGVANGK